MTRSNYLLAKYLYAIFFLFYLIVVKVIEQYETNKINTNNHVFFFLDGPTVLLEGIVFIFRLRSSPGFEILSIRCWIVI